MAVDHNTMPHHICQWLAYAFAVAVGVFISWGAQWLVMQLWMEPIKTVQNARRKVRHLQEKLTGATVDEEYGPHAILGGTLNAGVGAIEIILYASSVVFGHPEFIAVWFATKYVAAFKHWTKEPVGRAFYNRSLIGSGLNILFGFFTGMFAQWAIGRVT